MIPTPPGRRDETDRIECRPLRMQHNLRTFLGVVFIVVAGAGCGAGADCTGPQLSDAQVCSLKCGETSYEQAKALLGPPTASATQVLEYRATCGGGAEVLSVTLSFDSTNKLFKIGRVGVGARFASGSLPACVAACQ